MSYSEVWDLDVFFKGGSASPEFAQYMNEIKSDIEKLDIHISNWQVTSTDGDEQVLASIMSQYEKISSRLMQASAFIECLAAQDVKDQGAKQLGSQLTAYIAKAKGITAKLDEKLVQLDDGFFAELIERDSLREISFILNERRNKAKEKLSVAEETLIEKLSVDGYHGWSDLYDSIVGSIEIPFVVDGEEKVLSVGQAHNIFAHPDRSVRQRMFVEWEKAWKKQEELFAHALNHIAGFRLNVYESRGWDDFLKEPLETNRMKKETLDSMWNAITDRKEHMHKFLQRKAELLGLEKLSWYDLDAPLDQTEQKRLSYDEGAQFILKHFASFGQQLTAFTEKAFEDAWIEAEDRANKRPGGFCTGFPESNQSRIFMTYSGTLNNVSTLAHELGHAFHSYAMRDVHPLNQDYAMNVAETASTFAEMIVSDAAVNEAQSTKEKIAMLEDKIQRTIALLMNIHARFLFETRFYEERKEGFVSADRLNELMVEAQKEAYFDSLEEYHPLFWASKLHFYITGTTFYNFPYTFGYLFSLGIYEKALHSGGEFEEKYIALLKDTGSMNVEDLVRKHLDEDITSKGFWEKAVDTCMKDIDLFLELTQSQAVQGKKQ
ncbi:M3 family oligoendopeptidase [Bacillus testis]|uniref:M3 family oligoendopeptidase n=1 Tax=Bacillus testis TaxID=1622072 RepID=UPI00067EAED2|nr:M3 family oligoendopeptidase [Bacillus testis]